jgi:fructoselysine 6-kinase
MVRLVCVGDNTVDTYLDQACQFPGGNAVNVAVFAARLGAKSAYVGCVGADSRGLVILQALTEESVDVSRCRTRAGSTAWACVTHRDGDRVFLGSDPGVCKPLNLVAGDLDYIKGFDLIHSSIYSGLEDELPRLRAANSNLSFDFSEDWDDAGLERMAPHVKIAFLSGAHLDESACVTLLRQVRSSGPSAVVLTRGRRGSLAIADGEVVSQAVTSTTVIDTLGAGDGFIAAFLLEFHAHGDLRQAMQIGSDYAAIVCNQAGGFGHGGPVPPDEIERLSRALKSVCMP